MTSRNTATSRTALPAICQSRICTLLPTITLTPSLLGPAGHEDLGRRQHHGDDGHRVPYRRRVAPVELPEADLVEVDGEGERRGRGPAGGRQEGVVEDPGGGGS